MANVYIEARPKGLPHGSRVEDYVVEDHADHVLQTFKTQREAINWAHEQGHHPLVARVGISMTRRSRITGGQVDRDSPAVDPTPAPSSSP
jgi:hypothetical protein